MIAPTHFNFNHTTTSQADLDGREDVTGAESPLFPPAQWWTLPPFLALKHCAPGEVPSR